MKIDVKFNINFIEHTGDPTTLATHYNSNTGDNYILAGEFSSGDMGAYGDLSNYKYVTANTDPYKRSFTIDEENVKVPEKEADKEVINSIVHGIGHNIGFIHEEGGEGVMKRL